MRREQRKNLLRAIVNQVRKQEYPYEPREKKEIDWSSYDRAQINEVNDMLCMIRDTVDAAWRRLQPALEREKGPGIPPVPVPDLAKAVLVQQYFEVSNRETEGLMLLFEEKLGLTRPFSYKSVERAYGNGDVKRVLDELFRITQTPVLGLETSQAVDGTGMPTSSKVNYENDKRKGKMAGFEHVLTAIGTTYKLYSSVVTMESPTDNESPYFPLAVQDMSRYTNLEFVEGDAAFLSRLNCRLVSSLGAEPRFMPKSSCTFKRGGSDSYVRMLWRFVEDTQEWLRQYHPRSIAESGFSAEKRRDPRPIRRRLKDRKFTEIKARFCRENLRRLCYLWYLDGISLDCQRVVSS